MSGGKNPWGSFDIPPQTPQIPRGNAAVLPARPQSTAEQTQILPSPSQQQPMFSDQFFIEFTALMFYKAHWGEYQDARAQMPMFLQMIEKAFDGHELLQWLRGRKTFVASRAADELKSVLDADIVSWLNGIRALVIQKDNGKETDIAMAMRELLQYRIWPIEKNMPLGEGWEKRKECEFEIVPLAGARVVEIVRPMFVTLDGTRTLQGARVRLDCFAPVFEDLKKQNDNFKQLFMRIQVLEDAQNARRMPREIGDDAHESNQDTEFVWLSWLINAHRILIDEKSTLYAAEEYLIDGELFAFDFKKFLAATECVDHGARAAEWLRRRLTRVLVPPRTDDVRLWKEWWGKISAASTRSSELPTENKLNEVLKLESSLKALGDFVKSLEEAGAQLSADERKPLLVLRDFLGRQFDRRKADLSARALRSLRTNESFDDVRKWLGNDFNPYALHLGVDLPGGFIVPSNRSSIAGLTALAQSAENVEWPAAAETLGQLRDWIDEECKRILVREAHKSVAPDYVVEKWIAWQQQAREWAELSRKGTWERVLPAETSRTKSEQLLELFAAAGLRLPPQGEQATDIQWLAQTFWGGLKPDLEASLVAPRLERRELNANLLVLAALTGSQEPAFPDAILPQQNENGAIPFDELVRCMTALGAFVSEHAAALAPVRSMWLSELKNELSKSAQAGLEEQPISKFAREVAASLAELGRDRDADVSSAAKEAVKYFDKWNAAFRIPQNFPGSLYDPSCAGVLAQLFDSLHDTPQYNHGPCIENFLGAMKVFRDKKLVKGAAFSSLPNAMRDRINIRSMTCSDHRTGKVARVVNHRWFHRGEGVEDLIQAVYDLE